MITKPDGREVVDTLGEAQFEKPPLLVIDRLVGYLDQIGMGSGAIAWQRVGDGQSNITYRIERSGCDPFVLRRGPRPPLPRSTHDMVREAKILQALAPHGIPVPEVLSVCEDDQVLGVPFYLMPWLNGFVLTDSMPSVFNNPLDRRHLTDQMVETLARLHTVDVSGAGLAELGKPEGYLERQLDRFSALWTSNGGRDMPEVARLAEWLEHNRPETQRPSFVHGDYRLGNIMFGTDRPATPLAVLDWEMATIGDPLADLGYLVATYSVPGTPWNPLQMSPVTELAGFHSRPELVHRYAELTGLDVTGLNWYCVLALWKAAVFCEAIYTRWLRGERPGDAFGPTLTTGVPALLAEATLLAS